MTDVELRELLSAMESSQIERTRSFDTDKLGKAICAFANDIGGEGKNGYLFAESMKVLGYVNMFNRGISRVILDFEANGNPPPDFDVNHETEFRATLRPSRHYANRANLKEANADVGINVGIKTETTQAVFKCILQDAGCKTKGIAESIGVTTRTVDRAIRQLKKNGQIEYRGSRKTGGWYVRT